MKLLASLDTKDRRILMIVLGLVVVLFIALAVFTPAQDPNDNPVPDSYLSGQHGAKAAFTLLQQSGYWIERWEQPLSVLATHAGPGTVVILAQPYSAEREDNLAVATILDKGGRVLATGLEGGFLLPGNAITDTKIPAFTACEAQPEGLQPLAASGSIWIVPSVAWDVTRPPVSPEVHIAYTCAGRPVVVEYPVGKGHAVWWANSTPLENSSITRGKNLELLLNSIGPAPGQHVYWDESLHGQAHSPWDYTSGPVWPLLWIGAIGFALLVILSYSRRSGPIRELPQRARTTPIEFLEALGALYRSTGASATAMQIAWERFQAQAALLTGQRNQKQDARELAAQISRRFGAIAAGMETDLIAAEEACWQDSLKPRKALTLVQALRQHEETLLQASSRVNSNAGITLKS